MRLFFSYLKGKDLKLVIFAFFLALLQTLIDIVQPFLLSDVFKVTNENTLDFTNIIIYTSIMLVLTLIGFILGMVSTYISSRAVVRTVAKIRFAILAKVQTLSKNEIDQITNARLLNNMTSDLVIFQQAFTAFLRIVVRSFLLFFGGIISSFVYSTMLIGEDGTSYWWLGFIVLGFLAVLAFLIVVIYKYAVPMFKKQQKELDKTNLLVRENLLGARVIKTFNLQNEQSKIFQIQNSLVTKINIKAQFLAVTSLPFIQFLTQISILVLLMVAGPNLTSSTSSGIVASFIQMVSLISLGIFLSIYVFALMSNAKASASRITDVLNTQSAIVKNSNNNLITNGAIKFENVSFSYSDKDEQSILNDINFDIKDKQFIGIIGGTGSGKSSIINLLTRMFSYKHGKISISGIELSQIDYESLRKNIAVVPQKALLFSGTIRENLVFDDKDISEEEINEALKDACAYDFVQEKENGLSSIVEQRGKNFSGGQKQRLTIARALLKKPKILLLDDSTSALDRITEATVLANLKKRKDMTVVLIAQKISAIQQADQIIVLDSGRINAIDKHANLIKTNQIYKEIYESQKTGVFDE